MEASVHLLSEHFLISDLVKLIVSNPICNLIGVCWIKFEFAMFA